MSDDSRKELLARIRKCLALGKSANENEAAAAIAKARALMDAHGISDDDIALSEVGEAEARGSRTQRPPLWEEALCGTVRHALGCRVILHAHTLDRVYIGKGAAPDVAAYAFAVLFRKLKAARAEYVRTTLRRCGPARKRQRADVFCEAWASAVYAQVRRLMPKQEIDPLVGQYLARTYPNLVTVDVRAASQKGRSTDNDYWRGASAGSKVELHGAVGGVGPAGLLG